MRVQFYTYLIYADLQMSKQDVKRENQKERSDSGGVTVYSSWFTYYDQRKKKEKQF